MEQIHKGETSCLRNDGPHGADIHFLGLPDLGNYNKIVTSFQPSKYGRVSVASSSRLTPVKSAKHNDPVRSIRLMTSPFNQPLAKHITRYQITRARSERINNPGPPGRWSLKKFNLIWVARMKVGGSIAVTRHS